MEFNVLSVFEPEAKFLVALTHATGEGWSIVGILPPNDAHDEARVLMQRPFPDNTPKQMTVRR